MWMGLGYWTTLNVKLAPLFWCVRICRHNLHVHKMHQNSLRIMPFDVRMRAIKFPSKSMFAFENPLSFFDQFKLLVRLVEHYIVFYKQPSIWCDILKFIIPRQPINQQHPEKLRIERKKTKKTETETEIAQRDSSRENSSRLCLAEFDWAMSCASPCEQSHSACQNEHRM